MRGNTLGALIQMLRRELKIAESPALGKNTREQHAHALRSAQSRLFTQHDWPFKNVKRDITMAAGQRYYAPPADLDLEDLRIAKVAYSGLWYDLTRGINTDNYNAFNSDLDRRNDPVRNWDIYNDPITNGDMLEFWPIPASNGLSVARFEGTRKLRPLVADADPADLDDLLIVLFAAVDICPAKEVARMEKKASAHFLALRRNLAPNEMFVSGGGSDPMDRHAEPQRIVITPLATGG